MKQTIFDYAVASVRNGKKFKVDLKGRNLVVDKKLLIKNGEYEGELFDGQFSMDELYELYQRYKHSVPSERSEGKYRYYFTALKLDELDDEDLLYGEQREVAQVMLELYLLCFVLSGEFVWDEEKLGKWFWQSEEDKDFVILREWIDTNK